MIVLIKRMNLIFVVMTHKTVICVLVCIHLFFLCLSISDDTLVHHKYGENLPSATILPLYYPVSYTHLDVYKRQGQIWRPLHFTLNKTGQFRHLTTPNNHSEDTWNV